MKPAARARGSPVVLGLLGWVTLATWPARADPMAAASLSYERGPGAEGCPDEAGVREQVASRLGYDPFREGAARRVSVSIGPRSGGGLHARIQTVDPGAGSGGTFVRDIDGEGSRCEELAQSVVLAVSLAIDPMSFGRPAPPPPAPGPSDVAPPPPPPRPEPPPASPEPPAPVSSSDPWRVELLALLRGGLGLVPAPSLGPAVDVLTGPKVWALFAEAGADLPAGATYVPSSGFGVTATLFRGGLGFCARPAWLFACGRLDLGALRGTGEGGATGTSQTTLYADAALAGGVRFAFASHARAVFGGEVVVPLNPTKLYVDNPTLPAWTTPPVAGSLDLGLGYDF